MEFTAPIPRRWDMGGSFSIVSTYFAKMSQWPPLKTLRKKLNSPSPPRQSLARDQQRVRLGHGICEILQAVAATGSIKEAAANLGKSYRYVWGRIKKAEKAIARELVTTHVGGSGVQRSELTSWPSNFARNSPACGTK